MTSMNSADNNQGTTLRQAALIAGFSLLNMAVLASFAEFYVYSRLIVPSTIEQKA